MKMGLLLPRKLSLLVFLIISSSLISTSFAGRRSEFLTDIGSAERLNGVHQESTFQADETEDEVIIHERLLRMNAHDYGRYDPSPSFRRPRHKLIPN